MFAPALVLLTIVSSVLNKDIVGKENHHVLKKDRMLGVDAVHDVKIDKDTIITRNLKLDKKTAAKNAAAVQDKDRDPDWSYVGIPRDLSSYVTDFKRNMTECLKETQDTRPVRRLSPKDHSPVHGPCLIACVLKRSGVIEKGKVNKGNLINLVSKFYAKDTSLIKKLEKNLDRCVEISSRYHEDECQLATHLNDCTNDLMSYSKHNILVNY